MLQTKGQEPEIITLSSVGGGVFLAWDDTNAEDCLVKKIGNKVFVSYDIKSPNPRFEMVKGVA